MRKEYDFSKGRKNPYAKLLKQMPSQVIGAVRRTMATSNRVAALTSAGAWQQRHEASLTRGVPASDLSVRGDMSRAARSIFIFGVYIVVMGLLLSTIPNLLIGPLGFPEAREPWIRVLGVVVFVLVCYYVQAARQEVTSFFQWTIWGRVLILVGFGLLVVAGQVAPALILFGVVDAAGAAWTALELRESRRTRG